MIKWFVYIVLLLMLTPRLSSAGTMAASLISKHGYSLTVVDVNFTVDTVATKKTKQQEADDKKKIKEIAKARRQPKPEKIDVNGAPGTKKPKRQRRPEGLEQPPEIPRRSGGG
jgi:hypothetical protein